MSFTQKILAPTDFSSASVLALDAAAILAKQFGASITLLFVYDPTLLSPLYALPGAAAMLEATPFADFEANARKGLEQIRGERLADIAQVDLVIRRHANPAEGICEAAKDLGSDLVVLSTHGRSGLSHMLIGSVAERVVRHAPCPVLTLRTKAK
jgi:nucleotide-binding universal stress UspA family protein